MSDPTGYDRVAFWLAYVHPVWMLAGLLLALLALRTGLGLRRGRRRPGPGRASLRRRHLRLAKPAAVLLGVGFLGGPVSMAFLRGREPFETAHALVSLLALACFALVVAIGLRLERGRSGSRDVHALSGVLAVLLSALAFATGFVLLP